MKKLLLAASLCLCLPEAVLPQSPDPILKIPGSADRRVTAGSLLGSDQRDVRIEDTAGNVTVYHGLPLLDVLEKNGLQAKTMAGERRVAPAMVLAVARDGYTVAFSVGELLMHRADPRVFLVAESSIGALPANEGPVRLIVYGQVTRSAYGLARVELRYLGDNPAQRR